MPYAHAPAITANNLKGFFENMEDVLPEGKWLRRPLPKASLCTYKDGKDLHDDENGRISPSIWINLTDNRDTVLEFNLVNLTTKTVCTKNRFVWFMGFVPHRTYNIHGKQESGRISYSAYTKPDYEHLGLVIFNNINNKGNSEEKAKMMRNVKQRTKQK